MSLKLFQTYLTPGRKISKLGFRQKPTTEFQSGQILEADFSRVTLGATSGANVFRDGQLIELALNEPDWDDLNGCPVLKMRQQLENIVPNNNPTVDPSDGLNTRGVIFNPGGNSINLGLNGTITLSKEEADLQGESTSIYRPYVASTADNYTVFCICKNSDGSVPQLNAISGSQFETTPLATNILTTIPIGNGLYLAGYHIAATIGQRIGVEQRVTYLGGITCEIAALCVVPGFRDLSISDLILTTTGALTRSGNQFTFEDLVTKNVFSSTQWSVLLSLDNFQAESQGAFIQFLEGNSLSLYGRYTNSTNINFYNQQGIGTIVNFSIIENDPLKVIITYDNGILSIYANGATKRDDYSYTFAINKLTINPMSLSSPHSIDYKQFATAPIALTEAQALAALNEL